MVSAAIARNVAGIIGNVISFGLFFSPAPIFYKIIKKKDVEQFKPDPYIATVTVLNCVFWVFYGGGLVFEFVYLTIFYTYANNKERKKVLLFLLIEATFFAAIVFITVLAFQSLVVGVLCDVFNVMMYVSRLTIMAKVIKTKSVKYMPFWLSVANFLNGVCWTTYALFSNCIGAISGLVQLILSACYFSCKGENNDADADDTVRFVHDPLSSLKSPSITDGQCSHCNRCNRWGHDSHSCFQIFGYPEWWGDRLRGTGRGATHSKGVQRFVKDNVTHGKRCLMQWIVDTGASNHITGRLDYLSDVKNIDHCQVALPDGKEIPATKEGTVVLSDELKLTEVLYVPNLWNLISVSRLINESNCTVQFTNKFCIIQDNTSRRMIGIGEQRKGLYYFEQVAVVATSTHNFQLIHCDVWGPYRTPGARYFFTIVDDHSRAVWVYLLNDKKEVSMHLRRFLAMVQRQFNMQVKTVRSDNGTELTCLGNYFREHGILHETTSFRDTPQQNGWVERKHRHILNTACALRFRANLPIEFWGECILTAGYLINRTSVLHGKTPHELLYGKSPTLTHLRVFGCLCYVHKQNHQGDKFESRSRKCIFMGYPYGNKGWRVYDPETGVFLISRDVMFCEDTFPFHNPSDSLNHSVWRPHTATSWTYVSVNDDQMLNKSNC